MEETRIEIERPKGNWRFYLISSLGFLFIVLLLAAAIYFREEVRQLYGYGYLGIFVVGVLCGISIIPAPTLVMVFFLGGILNPMYIGLVAGFGGAIGGITVYMTGAGVETMWSRFRARGQSYESQPGWRYDPVRPVESRFWSRGEALYNRLAKWVGGKGGYWTLFVTSAMPISPFYFAGLAAGSLRMGLLKFFLISWVGKTVRYMIIAYAGYFGLNVLLRWIGG
ncbi:VTT domain-containing protein [Chloroflexota bacterium]